MAIKVGQLREKEDFQKLILEYLKENNGYVIRDAKFFDAGLAMDKGILFSFLESTQEKELNELRKLYKERTEETIIKSYVSQACNFF